MNPEEISKKFDISLPAAKIRAEELARVARVKTGELRPLPPGVLKFLRDQKRKGFRIISLDLKKES
jgi:FMN phosphatase YigB (HAD superfamily)